MYIYIYMYIYTYTYIHIYIYTCFHGAGRSAAPPSERYVLLYCYYSGLAKVWTAFFNTCVAPAPLRILSPKICSAVHIPSCIRSAVHIPSYISCTFGALPATIHPIPCFHVSGRSAAPPSERHTRSPFHVQDSQITFSRKLPEVSGSFRIFLG